MKVVGTFTVRLRDDLCFKRCGSYRGTVTAVYWWREGTSIGSCISHVALRHYVTCRSHNFAHLNNHIEKNHRSILLQQLFSINWSYFSNLCCVTLRLPRVIVFIQQLSIQCNSWNSSRAFNRPCSSVQSLFRVGSQQMASK